jgi:hypothetical protein
VSEKVKQIQRFNLDFDPRQRIAKVLLPPGTDIVNCQLEKAGQGEFEEIIAVYGIVKRNPQEVEPSDKWEERRFGMIFPGELVPDSVKTYFGCFKFRNGVHSFHVIEF